MDESKLDDGQKAIRDLGLLRLQYTKLQDKCASLEQKFVFLNSLTSENGSFSSCLTKFVGSLYNKEIYSDIIIKLSGGNFPGHSFVFDARGNNWGVGDLSQTTTIDFRDLGQDVGPALIKWLYTDYIPLTNDILANKLIKVAEKFKLTSLKKRCEDAVTGLVHVKNYVQLYSTAEQIGDQSLMSHCSSLISANWDDSTSEDIGHMTAPLLFTMFKSSTKYHFHAAVRLHREDVFSMFLIEHESQLPAILNECDKSGRLIIDLALEEGQISIAVLLLKLNISMDTVNEAGDSPLYCALVRGDFIGCNFLINEGCSLSVPNKRMGRYPLHIIASCKYPTIDLEQQMAKVAERISSMVDTNAKDSVLKTALHLAAENSKQELIEILVCQMGTDVDLRDEHDLTPLWYALFHEKNKFTEDCSSAVLVSKGASVISKLTETEDSFLHLLIKEEKEAAAFFLIANKAFVSVSNKSGETALHLSCTQAMPSVTKALLKAGSDPNRLTIKRSSELKVHNGEVDSRNRNLYRESPLHRAVRGKNVEDVNAILEHYDNWLSNKESDLIKPNLDLEDSESLTPLGAALLTGQIDVATNLQMKGANVDQLSPEGLSLLHRSILRENSEMPSILLPLSDTAGSNNSDDFDVSNDDSSEEESKMKLKTSSVRRGKAFTRVIPQAAQANRIVAGRGRARRGRPPKNYHRDITKPSRQMKSLLRFAKRKSVTANYANKKIKLDMRTKKPSTEELEELDYKPVLSRAIFKDHYNSSYSSCDRRMSLRQAIKRTAVSAAGTSSSEDDESSPDDKKISDSNISDVDSEISDIRHEKSENDMEISDLRHEKSEYDMEVSDICSMNSEIDSEAFINSNTNEVASNSFDFESQTGDRDSKSPECRSNSEESDIDSQAGSYGGSSRNSNKSARGKYSRTTLEKLFHSRCQRQSRLVLKNNYCGLRRILGEIYPDGTKDGKYSHLLKSYKNIIKTSTACISMLMTETKELMEKNGVQGTLESKLPRPLPEEESDFLINEYKEFGCEEMIKK